MEASGRWKNRIVGHGVSAPDQLLANPHNFRRHPNVQRDALRGSLDAVGVIAPVIVNTTTGHLLDGHARVEEYLSAGVTEIDVIYVELTEEEEQLALAVYDPIGELAVADHRALNALLDDVDTDVAGLADFLADLRRQAEGFQPDLDPLLGGDDVTDEDIEAARQRMEGGGTGPEQNRVLCPHCGGSFHVDA